MSSNYYLYGVILDGCPYSIGAKNFLDNYTNIEKEYIIINQTEKEKYKTEQINTFPQIYLKKKNTNGTQLIGGFDDIKNVFNLFYGKYEKKTLEKFSKKYMSISKRSALRLIELINS
jgi:glutaredoxin